jgi:asparagine synthetase B (glutamine-hydrolysing)
MDAQLVQQALEAEMGALAGSRRAIMFSGGFDSMLIACLARERGARVICVTVAFEDFNPLTVLAAAESAEKLGFSHHILHVKTSEFLSAFETIAGLTAEPVLDLDLALVYAALKKYDPQLGGEVFISGMGSDQWFGDLALKEEAGGLAARMDRAIVDEEAHHRAAQDHGLKIVFPFLSKRMLALAQVVPAEMKKNKKLLRELGAAKTIPDRPAVNEEQVPTVIKNLLIKMYGARACPDPVSLADKAVSREDHILRRIVLGLWTEKHKG